MAWTVDTRSQLERSSGHAQTCAERILTNVKWSVRRNKRRKVREETLAKGGITDKEKGSLAGQVVRRKRKGRKMKPDICPFSNSCLPFLNIIYHKSLYIQFILLFYLCKLIQDWGHPHEVQIEIQRDVQKVKKHATFGKGSSQHMQTQNRKGPGVRRNARPLTAYHISFNMLGTRVKRSRRVKRIYTNAVLVKVKIK